MKFFDYKLTKLGFEFSKCLLRFCRESQPANVNVNIANILRPIAEGREEMRRLDEKLDAIAARAGPLLRLGT